MVFLVDGRRYATPVSGVLAVGDAAGDGGAIPYRGNAVAVTDAAELGLGAPGGSGGARGAVLVVAAGTGEPRALGVDAVEGIVDGAALRVWPAVLSPLLGPAFPGIAAGAGEALVVVDAQALFRGRDADAGRKPHKEAGETS